MSSNEQTIICDSKIGKTKSVDDLFFKFEDLNERKKIAQTKLKSLPEYQELEQINALISSMRKHLNNEAQKKERVVDTATQMEFEWNGRTKVFTLTRNFQTKKPAWQNNPITISCFRDR
jgi:hypothetical protein